MKIEIDPDSGFCFGVTSAIRKAEEELALSGSGSTLYCLGDIVHNSDEVERLKRRGLVTVTHDVIPTLHAGDRLLFRAHGEPPSTYVAVKERRVKLIDATCPVVLRLQKSIRERFQESPDVQIVIYGKEGHAEVNGLVGQTQGKALVVQRADQLDAIDFTRPIAVYSQTTMPLSGYQEICNAISSRATGHAEFHDTICRQVASRADRLLQFARRHEVILFVAGKKSSNGRVLFDRCRQANPRTHLLSNPSELDYGWLAETESVGICGATSTPRWLMEDVARAVDGWAAERQR